MLKAFVPISLEDINKVSLMKRVDTKFVIHIEALRPLLQSLNTTYKILEIDGKRLMAYESTYFDTSNFLFYNMHHNGRNNRVKVRKRTYLDSNLSFLEVKVKKLSGQLNKSRITITDENLGQVTPTENEFITKATHSKYRLSSTLTNRFSRMTLIDNHLQERVTIDINLSFNDSHFYPNLVILELKQERFDRRSTVYKTLKSLGFKPSSMSKYCFGMVALHKNLKYNLFKSKFNHANRINSTWKNS